MRNPRTRRACNSDAQPRDAKRGSIRRKEVTVALSALAALLLILALPNLGQAQDDSAKTAKNQQKDLTEMSLEDLMKVDITSVSRHEVSLMNAPAAVTVIRGDDIRRTGATTIPDALRLVPGLFVAHVDSNKWIVSSRGFGDIYSDKLLVLIDGRTVYTPLFSGVFWAVQDIALEDVDRIEVIRGPGATVWGANAVNGVINVITKKAKDTQGGLVTLGGGSAERAFGTARYGDKIDDNTFYRIYAKGFLRDGMANANDDWYSGRAGFRFDWTPNPEDLITLQGDYYHTVTDGTQMIFFPSAPFVAISAQPTRFAGANVIGRWEHDYSPESKLRAQVYFDHTVYDAPTIREARETADLDVQHQFALPGSQHITWGVGLRWSVSDVTNTPTVILTPPRRGLGTASLFIQDEIALADTLTLTLGSKFEYFSLSHFEIEPGARVSWRPLENHTIWASAARAVRTPSQADQDVAVYEGMVPGTPPTLIRVNGSNGYDSEDLFALELGYRVRPLENLTLDLAVFRNNYNHLRTSELGATDLSNLPNYIVQNLNLDNQMMGFTWGLEAAAGWQPVDGLRFQGGYTLLRMALKPLPTSSDPNGPTAQNNDPRHIGFLRGSLDAVKDLQLDVIGRAVSAQRQRNVAGYADMDVRLGWRVCPNAEAAVVGTNLLHGGHFETGNSPFGDQATKVPRGVYGSITVRF